MACSGGCGGRTATGGRTRSVDPGNGSATYEVRVGDEVLGSWTSAVAAATFSRGHPGATVHRVAAVPA